MKNLTINNSPHVFLSTDTRYMMKTVLKALVPVVAVSLFFFRWYAFNVIVVSVISCVMIECVFQKLRRRRVKIGDMSAVVTGVLLALVLPPSIPLWMVFLGGIFAVGLGKELFGGLGHNIFNPALLARAFLMAAFPVALTTWTKPIILDTMTAATPLGLAKFEHITTSYTSLFFGNVAGSIGETSALALLIALAYLLYKKIIDYRIPLAYIGTVIIFSAITYTIAPDKFSPPIFHVLAGGLMIGAVFMATDPVTSPVTVAGRWFFGIGCGLITMTIRIWGGLPESVMYSILLMNALTPLIDRITGPKRFGLARGR